MELHQILTKQFEKYNENDELTFTQIEHITKERIYKDFLAKKTISMYPNDNKGPWNQGLEEAAWRKDDKMKELERKLAKLDFQLNTLKRTIIPGVKSEHYKFLKELESEREKTLYDLMVL